MKKSILILFVLSLISCNNDDDNSNIIETTEIASIITDVTSNNNTLDGTDVTIEGFLTLNYSKFVIDIECEYPCEDFTCNYDPSNDYLVRDTSHCLNFFNRFEISGVEGNYENAINLSFSNIIDLLNPETDCEGIDLEDYPITISGKLQYGTANNHELMLEQKSASIIIDEKTINLLNELLICTDL